MIEEYRPVKGYEGLYEVSNFGNVKSLERKGCKSDRILKEFIGGNRYLRVGLLNKIMTTRKLVNLMMKSSDHNPYSGKLTKKQNVMAAIALANLCKEFADTGQMDEAMNIESIQWVEVIDNLEQKHLNCA